MIVERSKGLRVEKVMLMFDVVVFRMTRQAKDDEASRFLSPSYPERT